MQRNNSSETGSSKPRLSSSWKNDCQNGSKLPACSLLVFAGEIFIKHNFLKDWYHLLFPLYPSSLAFYLVIEPGYNGLYHNDFPIKNPPSIKSRSKLAALIFYQLILYF